MDEKFERAMDKTWIKFSQENPKQKGIYWRAMFFGARVAYTERQKEIDEKDREIEELKGKLEVATSELKECKIDFEMSIEYKGVNVVAPDRIERTLKKIQLAEKESE